MPKINTNQRPADRAARPAAQVTDQSAPVQAATGTLASTGEFGVIDAVTAGMAQPATTLLGPGDDGAVVAAPDGRVVASVDVLVDGVHFRTDWATGEQIGQRAALAAMADIAAMGAAPTALLVGLCAPPTTPVELITGIGRGLNQEAAKAGAGVVGGDLTRSEVLTISVTVLGDLRGAKPVLRSGARPGDVVAVIGRLGWAAAGLAVLSRGFRSPAAAVGAYRVPEPPLQAGIVAGSSGATSMIDVSDGLLADLGHIAECSGVAIDVVTEALPVNPRLVEVASALGRNHLEWALTGGDDHALAATFPHGTQLPPGWTAIGVVSVGSGISVDGTRWGGAGGWITSADRRPGSLPAMPAPLHTIIDDGWASALDPVAGQVAAMGDFLRAEVAAGRTYLPAGPLVLRAFERPMSRVRVLIVGQDPYPTPGHPIGLSFAVERHVRPVPRSLGNIYKELHADVGIQAPGHGDLTAWSDQGVLLLNRVLTVEPGKPASHRGKGWEPITDAAIGALVARGGPLVAVLWGKDAQTLRPLLGRTPVIASAHPSPLSADRGFFGSRPFSRVNALLAEQGGEPVDWAL